MSGDCERCREELAALRHGEAGALPEAELRAHLDSCPECRKADAEAGRLFALLDELQPAPAENGAERLRLAISTGRYRPGTAAPAARRSLALPLGVAAAAAAVLVAVWVGALLLGGHRHGVKAESAAVLISSEGVSVEGASGTPDGLVLVVGTRLRVAPDGHACLLLRRGARVDLAGGSVFEVPAGDRLHLESGRLLAVVRKGEAPFSVTTRHAEVLTLGTRFTVEAGADRTLVAVSEGRVRFTHTGPGDGRVEVGGGEASVVLSGSAPLAPRPATADELAWAPRPRRARLELELVLEQRRLKPGERLTARLMLFNRSAAEVTVDGAGRGRPNYFVRVEDPSGRRAHFAPTVLRARVGGLRTESPLVAVAPGEAFEMELDLGPLAGAPGEYRLTAVYLESAASASTDWSGALESAGCRVVLEAPPAKSGGRKAGVPPAGER